MSIDLANGVINLRFRYKFSVEKVFAALQQGKLFDLVGGVSNRSEHNFEVGGEFKAFWNASEYVIGRYLSIEPLKKVIFTWEEPTNAALKSQVEIEIKNEANFTILNLKHTVSSEDTGIHSYHQGWTECLAAFTDELDGTTIRVEKEFPVSLNVLFQAVSKGKLFEFNGCDLSKGSFDFRESGKFNLPIGENDFFKGAFEKIFVNDCVGFTFESMHDSDSIGQTKVKIFFKEMSDKRSKLFLVHDGFLNLNHSEGYRLGWIDDLAKFADHFGSVSA